jgi:myo-inositol-1(or 4)-monophosphatase
LDPRKNFITDILPRVTEFLDEGFPKKFSYSYQKGYLAEADVRVHEFVTSEIRSQFPDDQILSEEGESCEASIVGKGGHLWILDPICGSMNFVYGLPLFACSLCVLDEEGVLFAGIYDPNRDELFFADRFVATLNGEKISVSDTATLSDALITLNCNQSDWKGEGPDLQALVNAFAPPVTRRIHIFESANLELAYVACGRLDAYLNPADKVWDIAGGSLMVTSAGGSARILSGSISDPVKCRGVIASTSSLLKPVSEILEKTSE